MVFGIILLVLLVVGVVVIIVCNNILKKEDADKKYDLMDVKELGGKFRKLNKGKLALVFAYDPIEKRKKQAILTKMAKMTQVTDENGEEYAVGSLVSEDYYFKQFTSKDGPYIAYAIFPVDNKPKGQEEKLEATEEVFGEEQGDGLTKKN